LKPLFPFVDLRAQFAGIRQEVMAAVSRVMESQRFILGPEVEAFENEFAAIVGTPAAIGCGSGSDALLLALMALGVRSGDEVVTTPFTFVATVGSIVRLGAKPVFVDIQPETFNMDPSQFESAITSRTRAVIPVHLFGLAADIDLVLKVSEARGIAVVEDAAQAIGARYRQKPVGSLGAMGCFSFFPSKNLGAAGDGGVITSNEAKISDRLRILRAHGSRQRYCYETLGINSRLDAIQAAILRVKLGHVKGWTEARRRNAQRYRTIFAGLGLETQVKLPVSPDYGFHVFHQFTIRSPERDRLRDFLAGRGIPTEIYYPSPLHLQPAFASLGYRAGELPNSEAASREALSLPIYPELTEERQFSVVRAIAEFYGKVN
jgi:dTDP-4-amino-4,6-dideoxygalactose transaminase